MRNKPKHKRAKKPKGLPQYKIVDGEIEKVHFDAFIPSNAPSFGEIMESVDSFHINREAELVEEKVLTMALMEYLGREPQEADWRACTIVNFTDDPTRSEFGHEGVMLGTIVRKTTTGSMYDKNGPVKYTVSFEPVVPKTKGDA